MKLGYTIIYVADVAASLDFFQRAFGFSVKFVSGSDYGELETGDTCLAFAAHELGRHNFPDGYVAAETSSVPLGMEIALVTPDVDAAHRHAVKMGAASLQSPSQKPWGQTVSYLRCPAGILIELCTPVAGGDVG